MWQLKSPPDFKALEFPAGWFPDDIDLGDISPARPAAEPFYQVFQHLVRAFNHHFHLPIKAVRDITARLSTPLALLKSAANILPMKALHACPRTSCSV